MILSHSMTDTNGEPTSEPAALPITLLSEQMALTNQGRQLCGLGHHAYTLWTPADPDTGLSKCWCARGCGYYVRSDEV